MTQHILKTDPKVFQLNYEGIKNYEIRINDRDFKVGDELHLRETFLPGSQLVNGEQVLYTGRTMDVKITNILTDYGLLPDWCSLSFERL